MPCQTVSSRITLTLPHRGGRAIETNEQTIICHFCFEQFEIDLEIAETFNGHNSEIYDCVVCCNPNKISYVIYDGEVSNLTISDGNE